MPLVSFVKQALWSQLTNDLQPALNENKLASLRLIGDAQAPHIIAQAVYTGHLAAREFDEAAANDTPFRVERMSISDW